jgi:hypothetical protein
VRRKDAERAFVRLAEAAGKRVAESNRDVGAWYLDYVADYGGFSVREFMDKGGESEPFGARRRNAREFVEFANAVIIGVGLRRAL